MNRAAEKLQREPCSAAVKLRRHTSHMFLIRFKQSVLSGPPTHLRVCNQVRRRTGGALAILQAAQARQQSPILPFTPSPRRLAITTSQAWLRMVLGVKTGGCHSSMGRGLIWAYTYLTQSWCALWIARGGALKAVWRNRLSVSDDPMQTASSSFGSSSSQADAQP